MAEAERPKETGEAGGASASDDAPPQAGAGVNVGLESMLPKRALPSTRACSRNDSPLTPNASLHSCRPRLDHIFV